MPENDRSAAREIWDNSIVHELRHWEYWMTHESIRPHRDARMSPEFGFPGAARATLGAPPGAVIKALDLGSGPASTVGTNWPGRTVTLMRVDPLADEYNELLARHGYAPNIVKGFGETLLDDVAERDFDFVHSGNALDHAYDPMLCIQNMVAICRPGGWVYFLVFENEAVYENYAGMHQWNFNIGADKRLYLWNRSSRLDVEANLHATLPLSSVREMHPSMHRPALIVQIQKMPSAAMPTEAGVGASVPGDPALPVS